MSYERIVAYEHETLRSASSAKLKPDARQAFLDLLPKLPSGAISPTHDGLRTGSYCGLIKSSKYLLEILPKIYRDEAQERNRGLLLKMLDTCFDLNIWQEGSADSEIGEDLLLVVIRAFLNEALLQVRQGPLKSYAYTEERLTCVRGRLSLTEQIRRGRGQAHQLHCEFDELTADNLFNQAIKAALLVARKCVPMGSVLGSHAKQLDLLLGDVSSVLVTAAAIDEVPRNRLVRRYDRVLALSKWILQLLGPNVHAGSEQGLALLFDMNRLFQDYVSLLLLRAKRRQPHGLHHRLELTLDRSGPSLVHDEKGAGHFTLRPDISLSCDGRFLAILDTKWKRLDTSRDEAKGDMPQSDLYQMLGYAHTYGCPRLTLIYPLHQGFSNRSAPAFRFVPYNDTAIKLSVCLFDLEQAECAAADLWSRTSQPDHDEAISRAA